MKVFEAVQLLKTFSSINLSVRKSFATAFRIKKHQNSKFFSLHFLPSQNFLISREKNAKEAALLSRSAKTAKKYMFHHRNMLHRSTFKDPGRGGGQKVRRGRQKTNAGKNPKILNLYLQYKLSDF